MFCLESKCCSSELLGAGEKFEGAPRSRAECSGSRAECSGSRAECSARRESSNEICLTAEAAGVGPLAAGVGPLEVDSSDPLVEGTTDSLVTFKLQYLEKYTSK